MADFRFVDIPAEELDRQIAVNEPFAGSLRELVDAAIRTEVSEDRLVVARALMDQAAAVLKEELREGSWGLPYNAEPRAWPWGNPVIGLRNPFAPPLDIVHADGGAVAHFTFTAVHEGQPSLAHGGASAMVLDQIMGEVASQHESLMFTGTISFKYLRPTPLGDLTVKAWVERTEGRKRFVRGELIGPEGVTVEADGIFIEPRTDQDLWVTEGTPA